MRQLVNVLATDLRQGCEAASRLVADVMPEVGYVRQGFSVYEKEVTNEARDVLGISNLVDLPFSYNSDNARDRLMDSYS